MREGHGTVVVANTCTVVPGQKYNDVTNYTGQQSSTLG